MKLVIDESIGITKEAADERYGPEAAVIKDTRVSSKKDQHLTDYLKETEPGFLRKGVKTIPYSLQEEVAWFQSVSEEGGPVVYFYDEQYTASDVILRVRNWLLPETSLHPVPVGSLSGAAEVLFLIEELLKHKDGLTDYENLSHFTDERQTGSTVWVITTPKAKPLLEKKKRFSIYKKKEITEYSLIKVHGQTVKTALKGPLDKLVEAVLKEGENWLVIRKGLDQELDLQGKGEEVTLSEQTLPVNIPYIQFVQTAPAKVLTYT
ncbi:hypothetical protein JSY36_04655 [Bacillus sp. H-16]|uniref:hypothetical protein n=1 Tax=Alteribacter salitolerans TaxID=2912333 RepID=UPI001965A124|nr:hypothetical protein [Alteribacter salitolerans]MBM7095042.1 hypothetical protein [Alteribacter salitolerans]